MEDTTKVDAESTMPEADSEEAVSEVDKKVKVPKSKRFGKKESEWKDKRGWKPSGRFFPG